MDSLRFGGQVKPKQVRVGRNRKYTAIGQKVRKCNFCTSTTATYTCSQCDVPFCSAACFRSDRHLECAEHFYKKCVLDHLKNTKTDKEEQARFLEILKRNSSSSTNEDIVDYTDLLQEDLDSVDLNIIRDPRLKEFTDKLVNRLGPDVATTEDLDQAWFGLTDEERGEFITLVSGNSKLFDSLIAEWRPWWYRGEWQKPVAIEEEQVLEVKGYGNDGNRDLTEDDDEDGSNLYPQVYTDFERISKLTSKTPSPTIPGSIICTIFSYCHLCRLYNGEIACSGPITPETDPEPTKWSTELVDELFRLCPFLEPENQSKPPENVAQALEASLACLFATEGSEVFFEQKLTAIELLQDVRTLFDFAHSPGRVLVVQPEVSADAKEGPSVLQSPKALVLALSDLIRILERVLAGVKAVKKEAKEEVRRIELAKKKLIFYLSWTVELGGDVLEPISGQLMQGIDLEIEKLKQENLLFEQESQETIVPDKSTTTSQEPKKPLIEEIN